MVTETSQYFGDGEVTCHLVIRITPQKGSQTANYLRG